MISRVATKIIFLFPLDDYNFFARCEGTLTDLNQKMVSLVSILSCLQVDIHSTKIEKMDTDHHLIPSSSKVRVKDIACALCVIC